MDAERLVSMRRAVKAAMVCDNTGDGQMIFRTTLMSLLPSRVSLWDLPGVPHVKRKLLPEPKRSVRSPITPACAIAFLFLAHLCYAQTDSLALSAGTPAANGIASLSLVLTSLPGS